MLNRTQQLFSRRNFVRIASVAALSGAAVLAGCSKAADEEEPEETPDEQPETDDSSVDQGDQWMQEDPRTTTEFYFNTVVTLTAYCSDELMDAALQRCDYFENTFSRTIEGTDVWRINEAKGEPVEVADEVIDILQKSLAYCEETDGLLDLTIGSVSSLWDFVEGVKPDDADIQEAIKHIDYRCIQIDEQARTVTLTDPDAKIDLGGVAKGYIADDLAALFRDGGCKSACINLGGNVLVVGNKPGGKPWRVGIQDPNGEYEDVIASMEATDLSIVTSGLYEREFEVDGVWYYHILDPKTGYPIETDVVSTSVVSESSFVGDVNATIMFLLGHDAALARIESKAEIIEGMVIDGDDVITTSTDADFTLY